MTADIFPSYILEPRKILENITWFLNPVEKVPQKFLQITSKDLESNIYSDMLEKDGFIIKNISETNLLSLDELLENSDFEKSWFNLVFSLANEKLFNNFETICPIIHDLLRPSSYFIFEIKITNNIEEIQNILLQTFDSVNFLIPWSNLSTNPFSPFDSNQNRYSWVTALSQGSDEDPADWLNYL